MIHKLDRGDCLKAHLVFGLESITHLIEMQGFGDHNDEKNVLPDNYFKL